MRFRLVTTLLYMHDLRAIPEVQTRVPVEVRRLGPDEVARLHEVWPVSLGQMRKRLKRGDACYVAVLDGRLVCYDWVQTTGWHWIQPAGRWRRVRPGDLWIYHARTADSVRGCRIQPRVLTEILRQFRERGWQRAWIYTTADNVASQRAQAHAGFRLDRVWRALRLGQRVAVPLPGPAHFPSE
jgi:RimJ/RimL family protein N-acetyltransferase